MLTSKAAECRRVIARHSKSFDLASRLLAPRARDAGVAVYAWCRRCDDAIDDALPADQPAALARLRAELDAIYAGHEQSELVPAAFQEVAFERGIPKLYPEELLAGMEMDVLDRRYANDAELFRYCHRVAGVVGLMMCHVLGVSSDAALPHACHLGMAMQLTN
ncbi:MAG TPA: squalene/phytoene synthase family protein, partial [Planctomycetia bacterium]|nr:squalene/phytoene synthase family protein [Planctomycetia bacterium]